MVRTRNHGPAAQIREIEASILLTQSEKDNRVREVHERSAAAKKERKTRPKLTPKGKRNKIPVISNWPEPHAEMELAELFVARDSMMTVLNMIKPHNDLYKFVELFRDADSACTTLWAIVTELHGMGAKMSSSEGFELQIILSIHYHVISDMEKAVETLTCKLLDPTNPIKLCQNSADAQYFHTVKSKFKRDTAEVKVWMHIGDMLVKAFNEGNMQFLRGILQTLEVISTNKNNREEIPGPKGRYLISKAVFTEQMEERNGGGTARHKVTREPAPIVAVTGKRSRRLSSARIITIPLISNTPGVIIHRENLTRDLSDCSSSEDELGEIREFKSSKRVRHDDLDIMQLPGPELAVPSQETLEMNEVRVKIEEIRITEDTAGVQVPMEESSATGNEIPINFR